MTDSRAPRNSGSRWALTIFGAALLVRSVYFIFISSTACLAINLDPISDMEAFNRWGVEIVQGDWLDRSGFHPFHPWQEAVAPRETWDRWYGHTFHQEPLYPYFIALIYTVAPSEPVSVVIVQMLLGAITCCLTYLAARHLLAEAAARATGILSVLYGPYLYYESLLLRDTLLVPLTALVLLLLLEARSRGEGRGSRWWWFAAGLAMGLSLIVKSSILAFVVLILSWAVIVSRRKGMKRALTALLMAAGIAGPAGLVVARNLAVSAPPLKMTTRGAIEFINGNTRHHIGTGWFDGNDERINATARRIMSSADGRLAPALVGVMKEWSDDPTGFVRLQVAKLGYFFAPYEMPNNASFAYFRQNSFLLRFAQVSFFMISPLVLVGLLASWRNRDRFVPLYLLLASGIAVTVAFYVIARFRIPFLPLFLILAGLGLHSLTTDFMQRRWSRLLPGISALVIVLAVNFVVDKPDASLIRPQDHMVAIESYLARGRPTDALSEAERARQRFPSLPHFHRAAGILYMQAGEEDEAARALNQALERDPSDQEVRGLLRRLPGGTERP